VNNIINRHNARILQHHLDNEGRQNEPSCNCRVKNDCPLNGKCLSSNIIYQATVSANNKKETYIGLTSTQFKTRYNNHKASFKHWNKRSATELSKYIWELKERNINYTIDWRIITKACSTHTGKNTCNLCIAEKLYIIRKRDMASLNERRGLVSSCRHLNKYMLANF